MMSKFSRMRTSAFTLIELLIVIGLLGGLTALILPSMRGARHDAMELVSDYNQAGTARTLIQYRTLYNQFPNDMHTGLAVNPETAGAAGASWAVGELMDLPQDSLDNITAAANESAYDLTMANVRSLNRVGITSLAWGDGYNIQDLPDISGVDFDVPAEADAASGFEVIRLDDDWSPEGGGTWTFRGRTPSEIIAQQPGSEIIALFIAPTMDWESGPANRPVDDWTQGELELTIELEGQCPVPSDVDFRYYVAFLRVHGGNGRRRADLVGTACPECGILNP